MSKSSSSEQKAQKLLESYAAKFPRVPVAGTKEVQELIDNGEAILVDVRSAAEHSVSTIQGSLTKTEFEQLPQEAFEGKTVIPYCTIGYRSGQYATKLIDIKEGRRKSKLATKLAKTKNILNGCGVVLWTHDSEAAPLVDPESKQPVNKVHVFGSTWDFAAEGYESVTFTGSLWAKITSHLSTIFAISAAAVAVSILVLKFK